jgi:hypothetical protein
MNNIDKPNTLYAAEEPLEILGDPRAFVAPVPSARSRFALDVAPDAVLGRADALTDALVRYYDERRGNGVDPDVVERRVSHLIDMAAEATVQAFEELGRAQDSLERGVPDEEWDDA